jgi:DNA-binding transcriptional LysR family regulator
MELYPLKVFQMVANERSFSRAAEKLLRTQPAVSLAIQRLEAELEERLIDRSGKDLLLTDAGKIVLEYTRRFENLESEMMNALAELRDKSAGQLIIGANESTTLYMLKYIEEFRRRYTRIKIRVRRSLSSKIPSQLLDGDLELGLISYDPEDDRIVSRVIFRDHLTFVVSPMHRLAGRDEVSITELGGETFIAHNVMSPYRQIVLREFTRHKVALNMDVEMPTVESIKILVQRNEGVAFLPKLCVEQELASCSLKQVKVKEMVVNRDIRLVYPAKRALSHAAQAFLEVVGQTEGSSA